MTFYQELQLSSAGSKQLIHKTTNPQEKRRHILVYNFKVYLGMAFCVAVVSLFSRFLGSENSVVGVTVLLAVLVLRQADFGIRTTQGLGVIALLFAILMTGPRLANMLPPLAAFPSEFVNEDPEELKKEKILFVAGGVGTAPVYPQVKWLHEHGITADVILGAKTKDMVILEKELGEVSNLYVTTDDGSYGRAGMVTKTLEDLVTNEGKHYDVCVAIGPMIMMKFVCLLTKKLGIHTIVSMNPIMVDGTGMCGACRLQVGDEIKFACVDGPEFDGHLVDFDQAMKRSQMYKTEEGRALLKLQEGDTHHGGCGHCGGDK